MQYRNIALRESNDQIVLRKNTLDLAKGEMAYLIYREDSCLGTVTLYPNIQTKNLEIAIAFDENKVNSPKEISQIVDNIVASLGFYMFENQNILITLANNVDLTKIDPATYHRCAKGPGEIKYKYFNRHNHLVLGTLTKEMTDIASFLFDEGKYWLEDKSFDHVSYLDDNLLPEQNDIFTIDESFYSADQVTWLINGKKNKKITFQKDGLITVTKLAKDHDGTYQISSYPNNSYFRFTKGDKSLVYTDESYAIKNGLVTVSFDDLTQNKTYTEIIKTNNCQMEVALVLNHGVFTNLNISFYRQDKEGHTIRQYLYTADIAKQSYQFISHHKGEEEKNMLPLLKDIDTFRLFNFNDPVDNTNKTMQRLVRIFNRFEAGANGELIKEKSIVLVEDLYAAEAEVINCLKEIKGEIIVPDMQQKINDFLDTKEQQKSKYLTRSRSLKKPKPNLHASLEMIK